MTKVLALAFVCLCGCAPRVYMVESVDKKLERAGVSLERMAKIVSDYGYDSCQRDFKDLQMENAALRAANEFNHHLLTGKKIVIGIDERDSNGNKP